MLAVSEPLTEPTSEFDKLGFVVVRRFFDPALALQAARWLKSQDPRSLAQTWGDQEPGVPLAVFQNVHRGETPLSRLASDPRLLELAGHLIGDEVYVWSSKVNLKAAWCGTAEYYHQDLVYWKDRGYTNSEMLTCMTLLEPHGIRNGGLHIFPGSHHEGFIEHVPFININGLSKRMISPERLDALYANWGLMVIEGEPGDVVYFHANLVHGSAHNISESSRMVLLSQLNSKHNQPRDVGGNARRFNLERAQHEAEEASRRSEMFKEKYETQLASADLTFNSPVPDEERQTPE